MNEWWLVLLMLVIPAGGALIANRLACQKNRPVRAWTIAGLFFPLSIFVVLFLPSRELPTQADREREARLKADWRGHLRQIHANQRSMAHFMATAATVVLAVVLVVVTYPSVNYTDLDEIASGILLLAAMYLIVWLLGSLIGVVGRGITRTMVLRTDGTPRAMYRSEEDSTPSDRRTQQRLGTAFLAGLTLLFLGAIVYSVAYRLSGEEVTVKVRSRHEEQHISGYRIPGFITSLWVSTDQGDFQIESAWTFFLFNRWGMFDELKPGKTYKVVRAGWDLGFTWAPNIVKILEEVPTPEVAELSAKPPEEYAKLLMVANWGVAEAQYRFGLRVRNGDPSAAALWFEVAAEQGHGGAQFQLGQAYDRGRGVEEDDGQAMEWYKKAAEQDHTEAQNALARIYLNAAAEAYDHPEEAGTLRAEAFRWYEKAALARIAEAQHQLGFLYAQGWGAEKDLVEALAWCRLAGEGGYGGPVHCQFIESQVSAEQSGRAEERLGQLKEQGLTAAPIQRRAAGRASSSGN